MNVNEVIANRAIELAGGVLGSKEPVHPNDHVNRSQSSNDAFPTAMHLAAVEMLEERLLPAVAGLRDTLRDKATTYRDVVKIGRTHLMDATPITLGQAIGGWAAQLEGARLAIVASLPALYELALGGTAVGTGLNAPAEFGPRAAARLAELTGRPYASAPSKPAGMAAHDAFVFSSGALEQLAVACTKIANDVRWLASGPRAGIGEISIPANEPGSSIMPGKVNPTQAEALLMVCARVMGNHVTIAHACSQGSFELNVMKPVIAYAFLQSARLLADACASFDARCARGIEPRLDTIATHLEQSLMLVTALNPIVGYDTAARIAKKAHAEGLTLREAALALGVLDPETLDEALRPEKMIGPKQ
jgi:fumarate hydratase class II